MPLYEHVFIARQDLSNTQAEGLIEHFSTVLADNGGKVVEHEYWGVKTMAYKINKNRKGHYACCVGRARGRRAGNGTPDAPA
jgi:small subunit ribosomal protein S6